MKRMISRYVSKSHAKRRGFTLVELLVVIAIIGILVMLLLPAINMARESARRNQCATNIKDMVDACIAHDTMHGSFPPGVSVCTEDPTLAGGIETCQGPVWAVNILQQLEEMEMWNQTNKAYSDKDLQNQIAWLADNRDVGTFTPENYICPTADRMAIPISGFGEKKGLSKGNYAGCWGSDAYASLVVTEGTDRYYTQDKPTAGVFGVEMHYGLGDLRAPWHQQKRLLSWDWRMGLGQGTKRAEIRDSMSTTLMISEILAWDSSDDGRGGWVLNGPGSASFMTKFGPNSQGTDVIPMCDTTIPRSDKMYCTAGGSDGEIFAAAQSEHTNGVNVAFVDGATRYINETIDLSVWQSLGTRSGNEIVKPDF